MNSLANDVYVGANTIKKAIKHNMELVLFFFFHKDPLSPSNIWHKSQEAREAQENPHGDQGKWVNCEIKFE
uniref:Uncharacterized protein n=1 Tax=Lepeophtheirus salmonis TaxID=72036 RepID=A0A0K2UHR0_LEPSM